MKLYGHQQEVLNLTKDQNKVAYYLDMGLGKTFVGAEKMHRIGSKVNLIVCQKSKIQDWMEHISENYHLQVFDLTKAPQLADFHGLSQGERFYICGIINYELAWRRKKELLDLTDFTLMLDESSLVQNPKAKQTKFILKLQPKNVILLSGTPTSGKYENLWSQCHLLGWNILYETYNSQYVNWTQIDVGGLKHRVVDKADPYKNVPRLKQKLRDHGAVFMKTEDCFDLPEQIFVKVKVDASKEYKKFDKDKFIEMGDAELAGDTVLTERLCKRQLCGMYSKEKLQAFRDLAESTKDRLIVFYNFTAELKVLKEIAKELERPFGEVNGHKKDLTAYEQEDDSITFIQYQAGAMGLNLQKANKIVYFTPPDKSELFEQSKKRIHRIGQNQTCFYYLMLVKNSIETKEILPTLKIRKEWTDELFEEEKIKKKNT